MKKYTIVVSYKDGLYISQIHAMNEADALFDWLKTDNIDVIPGVNAIFKELLNKQFKLDYHQLVELDTLENVFCTSCTVDEELFLVNIIETAY